MNLPISLVNITDINIHRTMFSDSFFFVRTTVLRTFDVTRIQIWIHKVYSAE